MVVAGGFAIGEDHASVLWFNCCARQSHIALEHRNEQYVPLPDHGWFHSVSPFAFDCGALGANRLISGRSSLTWISTRGLSLYHFSTVALTIRLSSLITMPVKHESS